MSNRYGSGPLTCKVYIGGLSRNASREEIESAFGRYGKLANVFVARNPPGFAFVEFSDPQDAEDSVRALDGRMICGSRVKVELSHGRTKKDRGFRGDRDMDRGRGDGFRRRSRTPERRRYSNERSRTRSRSTSRNRTRRGDRKERPAPERYDRFQERERSPPRHKTSRNRTISKSRSRS